MSTKDASAKNCIDGEPWHDANTLRRLYYGEKLSLAEIGDKFDVTRQAIYQWMERHEIPRRGLEESHRIDVPQTLLNPEKLRDALRQADSVNTLADELDVCGATVTRWRQIHDITEPVAQQPPIKTACDQCGNSVTIPAWRYERTDIQFCNNDCRGDWLSDNTSGENSPHWKGGVVLDYGDNWEEQRSAALERDGNTCQACGDVPCIGERELDVHHIRPLQTFDKPENANHLKNLVALCRSCHRKWEGIPLRPQVIEHA